MYTSCYGQGSLSKDVATSAEKTAEKKTVDQLELCDQMNIRQSPSADSKLFDRFKEDTQCDADGVLRVDVVGYYYY